MIKNPISRALQNTVRTAPQSGPRDIYQKLGSQIVFHTDAANTDNMKICRGMKLTHIPGAAEPVLNCVHAMTPEQNAFNYFTSQKFTIAVRFIPGDGTFPGNSANEQIIASFMSSNEARGFRLSTIRNGNSWFLKAQCDGFQFRSNNTFDGGLAVLRWDSSASANDRANLFTNGVKDTKTTISGTEPATLVNPLSPADFFFALGWRITFSSGYTSIVKLDGIVLELRYWTRAVSDAEILTLYNNNEALLHTDIVNLGLNTNLTVSCDFDEPANGVDRLTGTNNTRFDKVGNYPFYPCGGHTWGYWNMTDPPANGGVWPVATPGTSVVQRQPNLGSGGGAVITPNYNSPEYRTPTTPTPSNFQCSIVNRYASIWYSIFTNHTATARLVGGNHETIFNHTIGSIFYTIKPNDLTLTEEFVLGILVTPENTPPPAYALPGRGVVSSVERWLFRTENSIAGFSGAVVANAIAGPNTSTKYLVNIHQFGTSIRFRVTNLTTLVVLEQTVSSAFWWPTTWSGVRTGTSAEVQYLNLYGHKTAVFNAEFGRDMLFVRDTTLAENLELEDWVKARA